MTKKAFFSSTTHPFPGGQRDRGPGAVPEQEGDRDTRPEPRLLRHSTGIQRYFCIFPARKQLGI